MRPRRLVGLVLLLGLTACSAHRYELRSEHDPGGIGKFYRGREIARVLDHSAAGWLDREERTEEERTDLLIDLLGLEPGLAVADIGAGSGTLTLPVARRVLPGGRVLAVDIQPEMLQILRERLRAAGLDNVRTIQGTERNPNLPARSVDLVFLVDSYHEFSYPHEMAKAIRRALRPGGRLLVIEYRGEDATVPIPPLHKMTEAQVRRELEPLGFRWVETKAALPRQHLMVFQNGMSSSSMAPPPPPVKPPPPPP